MNKIIILLMAILSLSSCCNNNKLQLKTNFLKIGFQNGSETHLRINGSGEYVIRYNDLYQILYENPETVCNSDGYQKIAINVSYFSIITEQEYIQQTTWNQNINN